MNAKPYVGITGFSRPAEVQFTGMVFEYEGFANAPYLPMFGFLCSEKRLADPSVAGTKSPSLNDLTRLATMTPDFALPMVHYHTTNREGLADEISRVFAVNDLYASGACRAVQVNMEWPLLEQLVEVRSTLPQMQIVLQIPQRATEGLAPEQIAEKASAYDGVVQYALLDPSGGRGMLLDDDLNAYLFVQLRKAMPHTTIGFAGGLSAQNVGAYVKSLNRLLAKCGFSQEPYSIDIQKRLRHECAQDSFLNFNEVLLYVQNAAVGLLDKNPREQFRMERFRTSPGGA